MTIDIDPSSADYDAYIDVAEADLLVASLAPFVNTTAWDALTEAQKENVILFATGDANSYKYKGSLSTIVVSGNNMMWPRNGTYYANGVQIPSGEIPAFIKEYVSQRCVEILAYGPTQMNAQTVPNNVKRQKLGGLEREFFSPKEMIANTLSLVDFSSFEKIKPYVVNYGNMIWLKRS